MLPRKILKFKASEIAENASNFVNHLSIFPVCFYFLYKVNMILSKSRSDLRKFSSILSALYSHGM